MAEQVVEVLDFGDYLLTDKIGDGTFAMVWKAIEKSTKRVFALKTLKPQ